MAVPPSGHMAGIWARNDDERGVHKAPANEVVRGALEAATPITKGEQDMLNPIGVNCIRSFPGRGIRVWGARTLTSDPAWRYLNVRRLFNYVEESIETAPSGSSSSRTTGPVGAGPARRRRVPDRRLARRHALRPHARARRSSSSATQERTRPTCATAAS